MLLLTFHIYSFTVKKYYKNEFEAVKLQHNEDLKCLEMYSLAT